MSERPWYFQRPKPSPHPAHNAQQAAVPRMLPRDVAELRGMIQELYSQFKWARAAVAPAIARNKLGATLGLLTSVVVRAPAHTHNALDTQLEGRAPGCASMYQGMPCASGVNIEHIGVPLPLAVTGGGHCPVGPRCPQVGAAHGESGGSVRHNSLGVAAFTGLYVRLRLG
jgi:hypothetical protein